MTAFTVAVFSRTTFEMGVLRERGELFRIDGAGQVANNYSLKILNKTQRPQTYDIRILSDLPIQIDRNNQLQSKLTSLPGDVLDLPLTLTVAREAISLPSSAVTVELCEVDGGRCGTQKTTFFGPGR